MKPREIKAMVEAEGLKVVPITQNKHFKAVVRRPDGSEGMIPFPVSPSDHRAMRNKRKMVRDFALGA